MPLKSGPPGPSKPIAHPVGSGGPLAGLRALELGTLLAAPFAGRLLADFGASVIKIEQPDGGDPLRDWGRSVGNHGSLWSLVQGRGKLSVKADLRRAEGQALTMALAASADAIIENFRPGRLEAWGLGPDAILARNPAAIIVRISGYGQTGPRHTQPAFGAVAEAVGGIRHLTGEPGQPPTRVGLSIGDSVAGLYGLIGLLLALHERARSGRGQVVDVALTESVFSLLEGILPEYSYFGLVRERAGDLAHNSAPTGTYPCADGKRIVIGANSLAFFRRLMHIVGRPDLADDEELQRNSGRVRRAAQLDDAIAAWTRSVPADIALDQLAAQEIPAGRISSIADIAADAQFIEREMLVEVSDPRLERPVLTPGVVPKLSRTPGSVPFLGRELGADTEMVKEALSSPGRDPWSRSAIEDDSSLP